MPTCLIRWAFERVQTVLASNLQGERTRTHAHYLKSTLYCGVCGSRLAITVSTGRQGEKYHYYFCLGRRGGRTQCHQPYTLTEKIERAIQQLYDRIQLDPTYRANLEGVLRAAFKNLRSETDTERENLTTQRTQLQRQQAKLLEAHYAGAIPIDLLGREQERLTRELTKVTARLDALTADLDEIDQLVALALDLDEIDQLVALALDLAESCGDTYAAAPDHLKRQLNQALFTQLRVTTNPDGIEIEPDFEPPFGVLFSADTRSLIAEVRLAQHHASATSARPDSCHFSGCAGVVGL